MGTQVAAVAYHDMINGTCLVLPRLAQAFVMPVFAKVFALYQKVWYILYKVMRNTLLNGASLV
jgi:hypothetical protein